MTLERRDFSEHTILSISILFPELNPVQTTDIKVRDEMSISINDSSDIRHHVSSFLPSLLHDIGKGLVT